MGNEPPDAGEQECEHCNRIEQRDAEARKKLAEAMRAFYAADRTDIVIGLIIDVLLLLLTQDEEDNAHE